MFLWLQHIIQIFQTYLPSLEHIYHFSIFLLDYSKLFLKNLSLLTNAQKNLRDLLVNAQLKPSFLLPALGSTPCGSSRCLTCQHIRTGTTVQSTSTGHSFNVRATATCKTSNVIYVIECKLCNVQYVGETQNALHIRLNGHRNDIRHMKIDKPVAAHFSKPSHSLTDLAIMVLEVMRSQNSDLRKRRESYWIYQLQSLHPGGLNIEP